MDDKAKAMIMAAFLGDSLALGVHWIYDPQQIADTHGRVASLLAPPSGENAFHKTKEKGEFTHYGDQLLLFLQSLAEKKGFDLNDFSRRWQAFFADYDGYVDGATRKTLQGFKDGKGPESAGSPSNDMAGAVRAVPLVALYQSDLEQLVQAARTQTRMTHNNAATMDAAAFFARSGAAILAGESPAEAMERLARTDEFAMSPVSMWVESGLKARDEAALEAVERFGLTCHTPELFPGAVQLIAKYETDLREGMVQAVMAGGDNAARASIVGAMLGAHLGWDPLPEDWLAELKKKDAILRLLEALA